MLRSGRRSRSRSDLPKAWVRAGRILLVINVVVLILSAFTEHLWTFDHFLRGGQDFELSLLALIAFFCLIIVFAQYFRRRVSDLLDRRDDSCVRTEDQIGPVPCARPSLRVFLEERPPGHVPASLIVLRI